MRPVDFVRLKELAPMRDVLRLLDWRPFRVEGRELRGPCPIHQSSSPRSRSFAVCDDGFYCHSCHAKGDQVRLWATVKGVGFYTAAHQLAEALGFAVPYLPRLGRRRGGNGEEERC